MSLPVAGVLGTGHHQDVVRLVHAGDVALAAGEQPVVAVAAGHRAEPVEVRAGLRLGDREDDLLGAVGEARQVTLALLLGAVPVDHGGGDGRGDHQQQQRAAGGGQLLADDGQLGDAAAPTAVLGGDVDAEVAEPAGLVPQLGGVLAGLCLLDEVAVAVLAAQRPDGVAELVLLGGEVEVHRGSSSGLTTASTAPGVDLAAGRHRQLGHHAVGRGEHGVFELHRFQGQQQVAGGHPLADLDVHPGHRAGQRREQRPGRQLRGGQREARQLGEARRPRRAVHEDLRPHPVYAQRASDVSSTVSTTRSGVASTPSRAADRSPARVRRPLGEARRPGPAGSGPRSPGRSRPA